MLSHKADSANSVSLRLLAKYEEQERRGIEILKREIEKNKQWRLAYVQIGCVFPNPMKIGAYRRDYEW